MNTEKAYCKYCGTINTVYDTDHGPRINCQKCGRVSMPSRL